MLPDGWLRSTVGAVCAIRNNLRFPISAEERTGMPGPYPYFGPTGQLDSLNHYRIDEAFALVGEDGDHFLKFRERSMTLYFSGKANVNNHAHVIGDSQKCLAKWFHYSFIHRDLTPVLSRQGVGRYKLTKAGLQELEIVVPPREEQLAIVQLLDTWGDAITTAEKLLANSRRQKAALVQHLLLGQTTSWSSARLVEIAHRIQRPADGGVHPVLMISSGSGFVRQDQKYSRFMAGKSLNDYVLLQRGEFAYNKGNSKLYEFGCVFQLDEYETGLVPHVYVCFAMDDALCHSPFFKYLFEADYLHGQLGALVNTGVRNNGLLNIRPTDFMNVMVPLPPMERQKQIAEVLDAASKEIDTLAQNVDALRQEKRALMQDLLTGKRRVKQAMTASA
ncbi:restriction endonuclease subunit S [Hydrogenophaga sp. BPS33]|uniref:restriction endonuclease subunit S n=1 Tax=Hydrogenophaga sp. BPS33 TaxID=2651974 RepID=UPI00131FFE15|nr:restriction endonuclease subunit S [Hydrogenophaga sp. BPS33]QHE83452.1 restriction endonuclease subunit S [Hydrogenophaga sp. BPS33]